MVATQGGRCELVCMDSGRSVTASLGQLRELEESVRKVPALARACKLAGVEAPPSGEGKEASRVFGRPGGLRGVSGARDSSGHAEPTCALPLPRGR